MNGGVHADHHLRWINGRGAGGMQQGNGNANSSPMSPSSSPRSFFKQQQQHHHKYGSADRQYLSGYGSRMDHYYSDGASGTAATSQLGASSTAHAGKRSSMDGIGLMSGRASSSVVSNSGISRMWFSSNSSYSSMGNKLPPLQKKLECTLEELCHGCVKKVKITRDVITTTGEIIQEEEVLTIKVKPGWKSGTKITFEGMGNERPGTHPADIIFSIVEKWHPLFRRTEGDDLELAIEIPLVNALTGLALSFPLLGGERMDLRIDDIIYPGYEKIIASQGMPNLREQGRRGDLRVKFLVEFPMDLTDEQRSDVLCILQDCC
ncbi:protein psi1-like [Malania oleifera]|uniref:protein psi1-like n=1 Tax=Malania oleifera TaxID=397392 RepID=UPI0025AE9804|nr:protein psi1-like [Malania oleifera]